ncbi:MAG: peptide chain release factor N(5)-glutamine methyltransferase [Elusimicrobiota bacterium]|jgi:release factor glutamine methyltransferase
MTRPAAVIGRRAGDLAESAVSRLSRSRVPEARASIEFIMAEVLGVDRLRARLEGDRVLSPAQRARFLRLTRLRGRRLPLAYVLGHQDFLGLRLKIGPGVLCPRPETEELAEASALLLEKSASRRILDIGTGTGCLALYLAKRFPDARVTAVDISLKALACARANAALHGVAARVRFLKADLFKRPFKLPALGSFDLVVSNPPYVPSARLKGLAAEVRAEPRLALDGGKDGLNALRAIISAAPGLLVPGGSLLVEMDRVHGRRVRALMQASGFSGVEIIKDLLGNERIASGIL